MENEKKLKFNPDDMIAAADEQFLEWMKNGRYAELIDTMPNLGRYSLRNQMLIDAEPRQIQPAQSNAHLRLPDDQTRKLDRR